MSKKKVICYFATSAGDWGGASRSLFVLLKALDRSRYEPLVLFPSEGSILEELDKRGISYVIWGKMHEPGSWLAYLAAHIKSLIFFLKNRVDLIHINHASYWRPAEMLVAKLLGIPVITHYRVINDSPAPYLKYTNLIVANSKYTAEHSQPEGIPKAVMHNIVDLERYDATRNIRTELGLNDDDIVFSFIGQVREIKGVDLFIQLAHRIPDRNARFLIVGECRDPEKFEGSYTKERLRSEIGEDDRIKIAGYRADVENVYRSSDVIVMPSRWQEPFGLINIEAGASSKPIIASSVGGIPEIIRPGENGFLFDKGNLEEFAGYARQLIDDPELRQRMGRRAREIVEESFTVAPIRRLEKIYDCLIDRLSITEYEP